jgi:hypothetical protein
MPIREAARIPATPIDVSEREDNPINPLCQI